MNYRNLTPAILLFLSFTTFSFSQAARKTDVNKDIDIVRVYEQVVEEGYGTATIYKELATAFYYKNEYSKSLNYFQKLFALEKVTDPDLQYKYKQILRALEATSTNI